MAVFKAKKPTGDADEWFYCVKHGAVEQGPQCPSRNRMGPYASREQAQHAMSTVAERNQEWDRESDGG